MSCAEATQKPEANALVSQVTLDSPLPQYTRVTDAINAIPTQHSGMWVIEVQPGIYQESVVIQTPNVHLRGLERKTTKIVFSRYAGQVIHPDTDEVFGTRRTATVEITASNVHLSNLSILNSFDYPANEIRAKDDLNRVSGTQAVALKTAVTADKTLLDNIELWGYQDTLYLKGNRAYMKGGLVAGHIDFIFGGGTAFFDSVDIVSRKRHTGKGVTGYITAPSTLNTRPFGFVFFNCNLAREAGVPNHSVALGRPWHPTTAFTDGKYASPYAIGHSLYINTYMDTHISTSGWSSMSGKTKEGSKKYFSPLTDARFAEFKSHGPGALENEARPTLTDVESLFYNKAAILQNWHPM
ncbi:pectinesterase family protein [Alteromonas sp. CI.11.F.A3]|uniref:pectinesterase family protein n=1 Tax=Alteromonas sp. CI.11.F.A3 TaxID=3079555 RepID=UPI0029433640|nr:pectinesterase family protein [Alteromonas sp. CI.11.F.A3]WOI39096.1 pectinesterase family protein [Alteromonas sp. CI.11.F.A3]